MKKRDRILEKYPADVLKHAVKRYATLLQGNVLLLNGSGTVFMMGRGELKKETRLFFQPLEQCLQRIIPGELRKEIGYDASYFCMPVLIDRIPAFYVAVEGFDESRLARDCALVAAGLAELCHSIEGEGKKESTGDDKDVQSALIEEMLSDSVSEANIQTALTEMDIDNRMLRAAIVIEMVFSPPIYYFQEGDLDYELMKARIAKNILSFIRKHKLLNRQDISTILGNRELVIFKSFVHTAKIDKVYRMLEKICATLRKDLEGFDVLEIRMSHGDVVYQFMDLKSSYDTAKHFLELGKWRYPKRSYYSTNDLIMDLIYEKIHPQIQAKMVQPVLDALTEENGNLRESLLACAETFVDCCMNYTAASEKLQLHRNTLHARLEKYKQLTGMDPSNSYNDALATKLAAIAARYQDGERQQQ